jgi:hypothetical protein
MVYIVCRREPMNDSMLLKPKRKTAAEYEAEADQLLAEMQRLEEKMDRDRAEIDRLRSETRMLREESRRLEIENQAVLRRINATVG